MKIGNRIFDVKNNCYIMGILNVTPDSFSDGGKYNQLDAACQHAKEMIEAGADIIDIGGESTRPGHIAISEEEEIERIAPVVAALKKEFDIPLSIDTYKSTVAEIALQAGADLVNDIWGFRKDEDMAKVVAKHQAACCLMHNREQAVYHNFLKEVQEDLMQSVAIARKAGIASEKIILDPGVGFGKTYEMNLQVIRHLNELKIEPYPMLLGTSRKSFMGKALDLPVEERAEATVVTTVFAVQSGCAFVRVHDVKENQRAIAMTNAILQKQALISAMEE